jgi:hypothetical protein
MAQQHSRGAAFRRTALGMFALAATTLTACDSNKLTSITNPNNYTSDGLAANPQAGIQLAVNGILIQERALYTGTVWQLGILGRENYYYFPTDSRYVTDYLIGNGTPAVLDPGGFASGMWAGAFVNMRNAVNIVGVANSANITAAQKAGVKGFAQTIRAMDVLYLLQTRDSIGVPVDVNADPSVVTNFVSRDSAYKFVTGMLDSAATNLGAAGSAFLFSLPSGWTGFDDPAGFLKVNRAVAARTYALRGSLLGNTNCTGGCYAAVLTALGGTWINTAPTSIAALNTGPQWVYSTNSGDTQNGLSVTGDANIVGWYKIDSLAQLKADNVTKDDRFTRKVVALASPRAAPGAGIGVPTPWKLNLYANTGSPVAFIRNEELILLRAEAEAATGALAAATTDINTIRTVSGGLAPIATLASSAAAIPVLYSERYWSLLMEGWHWVDARRWNLLATLPKDRPTHNVFKVVPIPTGECLSRNKTAGNVPAGACP